MRNFIVRQQREEGLQGEQSPRKVHVSDLHIWVLFCSMLPIEDFRNRERPLIYWAFMVDAQGIEPWTSPV
jgi:hypothetical protein